MSGHAQAPVAGERFRARLGTPWALDDWRDQARLAWCAGIAPEHIDWTGDGDGGLLPARALDGLPALRETVNVPAAFPALAAAVLCHRDPQRHALLYRLLWRIGEGERGLLQRASDIDIVRAQALARDVQRDCHKMKAFVRFRRLPGEPERYVAFFEPRHWIVDRVAPFFLRRFAGMQWSIITPWRSVRWDGQTLDFAGGGSAADAPPDHAGEDLWRTYYANIFNPARANARMMCKEMPQLYWKHLPEATLIPGLLREAGSRTAGMLERTPQPVRRRIPGRPRGDAGR